MCVLTCLTHFNPLATHASQTTVRYKRCQLYAIFADGWDVESVELVRGEVSPPFTAEFPDAFPGVVPKDGSRSSAANPESQDGTYSLE